MDGGRGRDHSYLPPGSEGTDATNRRAVRLLRRSGRAADDAGRNEAQRTVEADGHRAKIAQTGVAQLRTGLDRKSNASTLQPAGAG